MGGIKYYQLAKGEELPDEFCAVRDVGGEPSEYTFYVPEDENRKLRELLRDALPFVADESGFCTADCYVYPACCDYDGDEECPAVTRIHERARELGVEVTE